jgi:multisubunit Na+/H+ antiporter MnhG subunit
MTSPEDPQSRRGRLDRWVTAAVGVLFVGIAIAILVTAASERPIAAFLAALVTGGLGLDALLSAARNRRSFLSRIGPLP